MNSLAKGEARICLQALRKLFRILSGPGALFSRSLLRIPRTSSSVTLELI